MNAMARAMIDAAEVVGGFPDGVVEEVAVNDELECVVLLTGVGVNLVKQYEWRVEEIAYRRYVMFAYSGCVRLEMVVTASDIEFYESYGLRKEDESGETFIRVNGNTCGTGTAK